MTEPMTGPKRRRSLAAPGRRWGSAFAGFLAVAPTADAELGDAQVSRR